MQIILDFNAIRANILDRGRAHRARDQRQVFQPAHALRQGPLHEVVPVFTGGGGDEDGLEIGLRQAHAARGHVQHGAGKVARQDDVAAAAQYQARHGGQGGILQRGLQLGLRRDAYVGGRIGRDAEGIQALEGVIVFDGELWMHGIGEFCSIIERKRQKTTAGQGRLARCPLKCRIFNRAVPWRRISRQGPVRRACARFNKKRNRPCRHLM